MPVETSTYFSTPISRPLEAVIIPDVGGRYEPNLNFTQAEVLVRPNEPNLPPTEPQKTPQSPIELAPILRFRGIPLWDMKAEMIHFKNNVNFGMEKGLSKEEAVAESAKIFEFHVRGYHSEITKTDPVLLHLSRFGDVDGKRRIVSVNGRPIVDSVSPKERRGSVLEASRFIDSHLSSDETPNNTFDVLMSPNDWHGFTDQDGNELSPHKNAQVLVFLKNKVGDLAGLTFHSDLSLDQAEEVMTRLGVQRRSNEVKDKKDRIVDVVANPASLRVPANYDNPFDYVLDVMLSVRGTSPFRLLQDDGTVEVRSVEQIRENIKNFDQLLKGNLEEELLISSLTKFLTSNALKVGEGVFQQEIVDLAEKTILRLARGYLQELGKIPVDDPIKVKKWGVELKLDSKPEDDEFLREIAFLKTRAGCPPGMESVLALAGYSAEAGGTVAIGGMMLGADLERDQYESLYFVCDRAHGGCGKLNKRPRGKLIKTCGEGQKGGCGKDVSC